MPSPPFATRLLQGSASVIGELWRSFFTDLGTLLDNNTGVNTGDENSAPVMTTAAGGTGAANGADTWCKIATFSRAAGILGRQVGVTLELSSSLTSAGEDTTSAKVAVYGLDTTGGLHSTSTVKVISSSGPAISNDSFMLKQTTAAIGEDFELWMKKKTQYQKFAIFEVAKQDSQANTTITYNDGAAWQAATPTGAVTITSDWAGSGEIVPTAGNGWTSGTGCFYQKKANGQVIVHVFVTGTGTKTDATTLFNLPVGYRPNANYHATAVAYNGDWNNPGLIYIPSGTGNVVIYGFSSITPQQISATAIFDAA